MIMWDLKTQIFIWVSMNEWSRVSASNCHFGRLLVRIPLVTYFLCWNFRLVPCSKIVKRLRRRQYDPLIIERTIGIALSPSTALYWPFLMHWTLTNKAVGTIWRASSKPPHRRQGPDLRSLWLLVGTPSAIRPGLAFRQAEHSLSYSDVAIYIFDI